MKLFCLYWIGLFAWYVEARDCVFQIIICVIENMIFVMILVKYLVVIFNNIVFQSEYTLNAVYKKLIVTSCFF